MPLIADIFQRDLAVVCLRPGPTVESYTVVPDYARGGSRLTSGVRKLYKPTERIVNDQLFVSPDGRRIALIVRAGRATRIEVLRTRNLSPIRSLPAPDAATILWSPDSDHMAYQTMSRGDGGVVSALKQKTTALPRFTALVWSKSGKRLYTSDSGVQPLMRSHSHWLRIGVWSRKQCDANDREVLDDSWIGKIGLPQVRTTDLSPDPSTLWTTYGLLWPFAEYERGKPVQDQVLGESGRKTIVRPNPENSFSSQFWSSRTLISYLQGSVLFDTRESPKDGVWLGSFDLRTNRHSQHVLWLPAQLSGVPLRLARRG